MDYTTDKLRSMVRKWQTLIEAHVDVKTTDGFTLRMFCIGFTKKRQGQIKRTAYAQSSQVGGFLGGGVESVWGKGGTDKRGCGCVWVWRGGGSSSLHGRRVWFCWQHCHGMS